MNQEKTTPYNDSHAEGAASAGLRSPLTDAGRGDSDPVELCGQRPRAIQYSVIAVALGLGLLVWVVDAAVDSFIFHQATFLNELILDVLPQEFWFRSMIVLSFLGSGYAVARMMGDRQQAEAKLRVRERQLAESNRMFRLVLDTIPARVFWKDRNSNYLGCNRRFAQDAGLESPEEIVGLDDYQFVWKDEADRYRTEDRTIIETEQPRLNHEESLSTPDGNTQWIRKSKVPLRNVDGDLIGVLGTYQNVTKSKRAERALQESEAQYRELIESVSDIIYEINPNGYFTYLNPAAAQITQYTEAELVGRHYLELIRPDFRGKANEFYINQHNERISTTYFEFPAIRKDGTEVWFGQNVGLIFDNDDVTGFRAVCRDITGLKQAEVALKESEERFRKVFEEGPMGLAIVDKNFRFVRVNPAFCRMLGYILEEIDSLTFKEIIHPDDFEKSAELARETFKGSIPSYRIEKRFIHKNGDTIWVSITGTVFRSDEGNIMYGLAMVEDISARREAEERSGLYQRRLQELASELSMAEERERRRVAVELHDAVGQTLALSKIRLGSLEGSLTSPEDQAQLNGVRELIEQALQDTRSLIFQLSPPVLYELGLEPALEWLGEQFREQHGIACEVQNDQKPKPLVEEVRVVLFQAVRELLFNVVKHAQVDRAKVSLSRDNDHILICVEDNGVGFDTANIGSRSFQDIGFGLFNIGERLHLLGGRLEIDSGPAKGSRITLVGPLKLN